MSWLRNLIQLFFPPQPDKDCGENHPQLEQSGRLGGTLKYNDVVWLRGYRRKDGKITVKPDDNVISHEFRRVLHNNDPEMINANHTDER